MKYLGVLVLINVLIISAYFLFSSNVSTARILGFLGFGVFVGVMMVLADRITELEISKIGKFKAVVERAESDADQIAQIRAEVQKKADVVDLIVRDANRLKGDVTSLSESVTSIKNKVGTVETDLDNVGQRIKELHSEADFGLTVAKVTNDDREAFDELMRIADDPKSEHTADSQRIVKELTESRYAAGVALSISDASSMGIDSKTASPEEFEKAYNSANRDMKLSLMDLFWEQDRFSSDVKIDVSIRWLQTTTSLQSLCRLCAKINHALGSKIPAAQYQQLIIQWNSRPRRPNQ